MTLPVVESVTETDGTGRSGETMTVDYPATVNSGDTLLCFLSQDAPSYYSGWTDTGWPTGWAARYSEDDQGANAYAYGAFAVRKADGTEGGGTFDVDVAGRPCCAIVIRISGAADPTVEPPVHALHYSYSVPNINQYPPTLKSPTIPRQNDYAWITVCHVNTDDGPMAEYPAGYTTGTVVASDSFGCRLSYGYKTENDYEEDPGRFRLFGLSRDFVVSTVAVFPAVDSTTTNDERATQVAAQVLYEVGTEVRTTAAAAQVLYEIDVNIRTTQVALQVLVPQIPCARRSCQVWKITRRDGQVFRFTTHDEAVSFRNESYSPCNSLQASAAEAAILNAVGGGDIEINGLISDDSITEFDLANGLFDGATVEVWAVSWGDPTMASDSPKRLIKGVLGETSQSPTSYTAEVFSTSAKLAQKPLLSTFTPACRFNPGDGRCPINVEALTVTGAVTAITDRVARDRRGYRQFYAGTGGAGSSSSSSDAATPISDVHVFGILTWTTGNNAGIQSEIKSVDDDGLVTLWEPMPHEIESGDQYSAKPGCSKTEDEHKNTFGLSMDSFGGFPDLPGVDSLIRGPNR